MISDEAKKELIRQKLESAGWKVGSTADFLELTTEESAIIEMKLDLDKKELSQ